jgi:AAA15 family ATPase/GTPase
MIVSFSVENFLSFKDKQTLSFVATRTCKEREKENTFAINKKDSLLKAIALYGPNASGKSNIFSALEMLIEFIENSLHDLHAIDILSNSFFLFDESCSKKPLQFELEFIIDNRWYTYTVAIFKKVVIEEKLTYKTLKVNREKILFTRSYHHEKSVIKCTPSFKGADDFIALKTRSDALFLTTCASFAVKEAKQIFQKLTSSFVFVNKPFSHHRTARMLFSKEYTDEILRLIHTTDPAIDNLEIEEKSKEIEPYRIGERSRFLKHYSISFFHNKSSNKVQQIPNSALSLGTKIVFELAGPLFNALKQGKVIIIDEFGASMHTLLTKELVMLFYSSKTNPYNAQLIFNTHDTNLLSFKANTQSPGGKSQHIFRRDQVYFLNRDNNFSSRLYSLISLKPKTDGERVRNDASFEKEYLLGTYDAIPQFDGTLEE